MVMLGVCSAGIRVCFGAVDSGYHGGMGGHGDSGDRVGMGDPPRMAHIGKFSFGVVLIGLSAAIKLTAICAFPVILIPLIRSLRELKSVGQRNEKNASHTSHSGSFFVIFSIISYCVLLEILVFVVIDWFTGLGTSWVQALLAQKHYGSFMPVYPLIAQLVNALGEIVYFGDHSQSLDSVISKLLQLLFIIVSAIIWLRCYRGKSDPLFAIGWIFIAFMLLGVGVVQPWYIIWFLPFIALGYPQRMLRYFIVFASCYVFISTPGGRYTDVQQLVYALLSSFIIVIVVAVIATGVRHGKLEANFEDPRLLEEIKSIS